MTAPNRRNNLMSATTTATASGPLTLTVEEAGRLLGISRGAAYRAAACGQIPTIRLGRRLLVPTARLHQLLGLTDPGLLIDADEDDPVEERGR
jgi:excisionase family DNA binding protein